MNAAEQKSVAKARQILMKHGLVALDGSGDPNVEALFTRLYSLDREVAKLKEQISRRPEVFTPLRQPKPIGTAIAEAIEQGTPKEGKTVAIVDPYLAGIMNRGQL